MSKVVKGSALIDDFGGVTFTPYDSNPAENSPWTLLASTEAGKLQCSKKKLNLVVTIDRTASASEAIAKMNRHTAALISELVKASVERRYQRSGKKN